MGDINLNQYSDKRSYNSLPTPEGQYPGTMKLFWSDVRTYIADLKKDPNILSYDKMLEDMMSEDGNGYDPAQTANSAQPAYQLR